MSRSQETSASIRGNRFATSRRNVLKTAGMVGFGFEAPQVIGEQGFGDETVTITTVEAHGQPLERKEVPADWWAYERQAMQSQRRLESRFGTNNSPREAASINGVGFGTMDETISGRRISTLEVYVDPSVRLTADVPSNADGVPVDLVETQSPLPHRCNSGNFDPMPGGVGVGQESGEYNGTATCEVERHNKRFMLTSAHLFTCRGRNITGERFHQNRQYVGRVADHSLRQDWAVVPRGPNSQIGDFENRIVDTPGILSGHVTRHGLFDLKGSGHPVHNQGVQTCQTTGRVEKVDTAITNCNGKTGRRYVKLSTDTRPGDSGSPHYKYYRRGRRQYLAIIAPHYGGDSYGWAAYHLNRSQGIEFDPEFSME